MTVTTPGEVATPPVPARPAAAVRILHTSDWHLGVSVRNESRAADHDALIAELVAVARSAEPDLIVHTGDLFDGHRPPMPEMARAIRALRALGEVAPVALLAGNHDSPVALEVLGLATEDALADPAVAAAYDPLAPQPSRIRVHARPTVAERGAVSTYPTHAGGRLRLVALPFVHQNRVVTTFGELIEANATYNDQLRKIIGSYSAVAFSDFDPARDVAVFASHVHVRDARTSTEKTIHIAEDYATDPAHFEPRYGYLAFGHIHVPQPVADGRGRYAGSLLEVDFGEEGEAKQVVLVDLTPGRPTAVHPVPLTSGRRLHRLTAPLSQLADHADRIGNGIVEVTVAPEPEPEDTLPFEFDSLHLAVTTMLPDATVVGVIDGRVHRTALDVEAAPPVIETVGDAFRSWLAGPGALVAARAGDDVDLVRVGELFDECHAAVTTGAPVELAELTALAALDANTAGSAAADLRVVVPAPPTADRPAVGADD